jgi:hypothetical protein
VWSIVPLIFTNTPVSARTASVILAYGPRPAMPRPARLTLVALSIVLAGFAYQHWASARGDPATSVQGVWVGQYGCAQGMTGLTLTVGTARNARMRALFHFYADPSEPSVPEGCFEMDGTYDSLSGHVELRAGNWILRPPGYVTVNLSGVVDASGESLSGTVIGPYCTKFALHRVAAATSVVRASCPSKPAAVSLR